MNARFIDKGKHKADLATLNALINYFEHGGTITVCKAGRRSKANTSFPQVHGTVANQGRKAQTLAKTGVVSKRKG